MLPPLVADWAWRVLGILCIRYMARSWLMTGVWLLFPGALIELTAGNVTFQLAALTVAGLRGRAEGILPAALVKVDTLAVVPFLWFRRPAARKGLLVGGAIAVLMVGASVILGPELWRDYAGTLGSQAGLSLQSTDIVHILPSTGTDFVLRLAIATIIIVASIRFDSPHLAFIAMFIAAPTIWAQRSVVLLALLTLEGDGWLKPYLWPWRAREQPA
jgi:hypothetical protein